MLQSDSLTLGYGRDWTLSLPALSLPRAQHCLLLGPSGSGKTTVLHALAGLLKPLSGEIRIEGTDITQFSAREMDRFRAYRIGIVFQALRLIPSLTVLENLMISSLFADRRTDRAKAMDMLARVGLDAKANDKPETLSQGQAQRVAIARALINRPLLLLADEPTSSLDDKHCDAVIELLLTEAKGIGTSLVIATHDHRLRPYFEGHQILTLGDAA